MKRMDWDLEINLFYFLHFYNCKREHATTCKFSKGVLDNFNYEKVREKVIITTENLDKSIRKNLYKVEEVVMIKNRIHKIDLKNIMRFDGN